MSIRFFCGSCVSPGRLFSYGQKMKCFLLFSKPCCCFSSRLIFSVAVVDRVDGDVATSKWRCRHLRQSTNTAQAAAAGQTHWPLPLLPRNRPFDNVWMLPANFAHAQKLVLELVAQGCMLTAFCFSVMMMPVANMLGGADSKEASRRFRHWRNSMFDSLQTA